MERELAAVFDELNRRLGEGEKTVYLTGESLAFLREAAARKLEASERPQAAAPEPELLMRPADSTANSRRSGKEEQALPGPPECRLPEGAKDVQLEVLREWILGDSWSLSQVKPGRRLVPGTGDLNARIFFCGEAPGAEEEKEGLPFVGPAGQLLTRIIKAMGLSRERVYIANIMTYRPPPPGPVGNRPPTPEEMAYCLPYLVAQLEIVQPEVIVGLGKTALDGLLGRDPKRRMTRIRGKWQEFRGIPLMPT
ncbi:MAG: uracil-DNA glycosylase, partial [Oceanipulchritudo sp.]